MKHYLKHLQSLVAVALVVIFAVALSSCSNDDDEPATDNLSSIIPGVWAQDGDDDIMVFNANGTGLWYGSPAEYKQGVADNNFTWDLKGEWLTINIIHSGETNSVEVLKSRPKRIVSKDKIIWQDYDEIYSEFSDLKDSFGYYVIWTWERYPD